MPTLLATLSSAEIDGSAIASNGSDVLILTSASGGVIEECSVHGCNENPATIVTTGLDEHEQHG